jgi:hypothetical protein
MSEREIDQEKVREEHLAEVNVGVQWVYLVAVIIGGLLVMLLLIAYLGG